MSWARLDDAMDENRKLRRLPDHAFRLYWLAVSWSRRNGTGGRLYQDDVETLAAKHRIRRVDEAIRELLVVPYDYEHGCWERLGRGVYQIHDFGQYNPLTSTERVRRHRNQKPPEEGDLNTDGPADADPDGGSPRDLAPLHGGPRNADETPRNADETVPPAGVPALGSPNPNPKPVPITQNVTSSVEGSLTAPSGQQPRAPADEVTLPSGVQIVNSGNGAFAPTEQELRLVARYLEITGNQPTGTDVIKAREFLGELRYLNVDGMVDSIEKHVERQRHAGHLWPKTLGSFWKILRADNDYARDYGTRERVGA